MPTPESPTRTTETHHIHMVIFCETAHAVNDKVIPHWAQLILGIELEPILILESDLSQSEQIGTKQTWKV